MIADSTPILRKPTPPLIPGTLQWEMSVIDSSENGHGLQDTRFIDGSIKPGIGRGVFRIYTDGDGKMVGYTSSTSPISKYYNEEARPLYVVDWSVPPLAWPQSGLAEGD